MFVSRCFRQSIDETRIRGLHRPSALTAGCKTLLGLALTCVVTVGIMLPRSANAQNSARMPIIGFIALASHDPAQVSGFEQGLVESGHVLGKTVRVEARFGNGSRERMRMEIEELVGAGVAVFVAAGPNVAKMIQSVSKDAAIVVASLESLEVAGVSGTIPRPNGNVTGLATLQGELIAKRIELLREVVPGLAAIAAVTHTRNRNNPHLVIALRSAAKQLGIDARTVDVDSIEAIEPGLMRAREAGAGAVMFLRDFLFESNRDVLVDAVSAAGLPSTFDEAAFVRIGGLMSYAPDRPSLFRRSGQLAAKILAGARPADIPIELPTRFELTINLKTAARLSLMIPPALLLRADEVIE